MDTSVTSKAKTILLVDDESACRITTRLFLTSFGYTVESARSAEDALALFDAGVHDMVITDNRMTGMSGAEMAHIVKLRSPVTPIIMYSGSPPEDQSCLDRIIQRPTHLLVLKEMVDELFEMKPA